MITGANSALNSIRAEHGERRSLVHFKALVTPEYRNGSRCITYFNNKKQGIRWRLFAGKNA